MEHQYLSAGKLQISLKFFYFISDLTFQMLTAAIANLFWTLQVKKKRRIDKDSKIAHLCILTPVHPLWAISSAMALTHIHFHL